MPIAGSAYTSWSSMDDLDLYHLVEGVPPFGFGRAVAVCGRRIDLCYGPLPTDLVHFVDDERYFRLAPDVAGTWLKTRDWREVEVLTSRTQTSRPWGGIGVIHSPRVSAAAGQARLDSLRLQARKRAAAMGADAVIVTVDSAASGPQMGVYEEPELYLSALAIKYVTEASTSTAK